MVQIQEMAEFEVTRIEKRRRGPLGWVVAILFYAFNAVGPSGSLSKGTPLFRSSTELARAWRDAGRRWVWSVPLMISATKCAGVSSTSW